MRTKPAGRPKNIDEKKPRQYPGMAEGRLVTEWLNETHDTEGRKLVLALLQTFKAALDDPRISVHQRDFPALQPETIWREWSAAHWRSPLLLNLNKQLRNFGSYPHCEFVLDGKFMFRAEPIAEHAADIESAEIDVKANCARAGFAIVRIAEVGRIEYLKECDFCSRWFYAARRTDRWCPGGRCKSQFYNAPSGRKEKAKNTSKNRADHRNQQKNNLEYVKRSHRR